MGNRHIEVGYGLSVPSSRFSAHTACVLLQFLKQIPRHIVFKKRSVANSWRFDANWSAWKSFSAKNAELATILPDQGVEEILGLDVGSAAVSRGPEGRRNQLPRPVRIPLERGSIMAAEGGCGNSCLRTRTSACQLWEFGSEIACCVMTSARWRRRDGREVAFVDFIPRRALRLAVGVRLCLSGPPTYFGGKGVSRQGARAGRQACNVRLR